ASSARARRRASTRSLPPGPGWRARRRASAACWSQPTAQWGWAASGERSSSVRVYVRVLTVFVGRDAIGCGLGGFRIPLLSRLRISLLATFRIPADVLLTGAGDAERSGRNVLRDHRSSRRVCLVAHGQGRHEHRVDADLDACADLRAVLTRPVVIRGDRPCANVGLLADLGVTYVREVGHLRAGGDSGVLDLHKRARLRSVAQN